MIKKAIILAGGLGLRLRSIIPDLPKPLAPVNGRPFLLHIFDYLIGQGINEIIISVGYQHQKIIDQCGHEYRGVVLQYLIEESQLGTGGALMLAVEKCVLKEPFILINGDTFFQINLKKLDYFASLVDSDWCFSLFKSSFNSRFMGLEINSKGQVLSLEVKNNDKKFSNILFNGGIYRVNPRRLKELNLKIGNYISLENDIFPKLLLLNHKVFGKYFSNVFVDIGIPEDYFLVSKHLE